MMAALFTQNVNLSSCGRHGFASKVVVHQRPSHPQPVTTVRCCSSSSPPVVAGISSSVLSSSSSPHLHKSSLWLISPPEIDRNVFRCFASTPGKGASPGLKEQKWDHEGLITESLPNGMFRVRLDNEDIILGYVSGKIRKSFIRILPGDRVKIEVSRYDSTKGRIIYRLRTKNLND